jgi:hypothetical protein
MERANPTDIMSQFLPSAEKYGKGACGDIESRSAPRRRHEMNAFIYTVAVAPAPACASLCSQYQQLHFTSVWQVVGSSPWDLQDFDGLMLHKGIVTTFRRCIHTIPHNTTQRAASLPASAFGTTNDPTPLF